MGNIANAVVGGLVKGPFTNVNVWTEVLQDTMLDFFDSGKLNFASSTSLSLSVDGFKRLYADWEKYTSRVVLRPIQYSNHPEPIRRLGVIAMNTPVEFDIYGHANSTLVERQPDDQRYRRFRRLPAQCLPLDHAHPVDPAEQE